MGIMNLLGGIFDSALQTALKTAGDFSSKTEQTIRKHYAFFCLTKDAWKLVYYTETGNTVKSLYLLNSLEKEMFFILERHDLNLTEKEKGVIRKIREDLIAEKREIFRTILSKITKTHF